MTSYWKVYEAFLAKTLEDEWGDWTIEETEEDMRQLLESAIPYFKFPRVSFDRNEEGFVEDLNPEEIQILFNGSNAGILMKALDGDRFEYMIMPMRLK